MTSEWRYSHYDNGLYIRSLVQIKWDWERRSPWAFTKLSIMMLKRLAANVITFWWLVWELCQHSFLNISHCNSDYSNTLTSQWINFLCLIPSKQHGLGLFYQHIQLLQHQVSGYAWRYLDDFILFFNLHSHGGEFWAILACPGISVDNCLVWSVPRVPYRQEAWLAAIVHCTNFRQYCHCSNQ